VAAVWVAWAAWTTRSNIQSSIITKGPATLPGLFRSRELDTVAAAFDGRRRRPLFGIRTTLKF
jgi:hypothetical protein